ncbi:uncharacterized protein LOC102700308 isoform X1 [Oryza brachyantha]|uniref:uncharacterized protein LOC102700308 isoform X1 n=1 Tax=Oryza brachyantha TaxID=4533 RepID=UPI001ADBD003|nr:uncharacterized protein LOC102700308 isoform X1 [Oryza brachyantha]XP_040377001.1 uncharacterized protein LOC102700308 isoform X1 [Oryza brachyantha]XP_040377002.1 uncharacterized protein LOC102700308 isoform X1 [Oryza brachyantha]
MPPPPPAAVLVTNGVTSPRAPPPAASFLEATPGAYTTARASSAGRLLWWPRHLLRLADSARLLARLHPHLLGLVGPPGKPFEGSFAGIEPLVNRSVRVALEEMRRRRPGEGMALTALLRASAATDDLEVCVHLGAYVPPVFGEAGARLAVAGRGRDAAAAKYAPWARMRKSMEKMRPPGVTELLLTNDGDHILEGSITNFFVVCRRMEEHQLNEPVQVMANKFEVQTAPLSDGVLPGIIRQIVMEVCHDIGIPFREVSPSWSKCNLWEEAFVTSSLRLIQHVETVQAPLLWENIESKTWADVSWEVKQFKGAGSITTQIKREISKRAVQEEYDIRDLLAWRGGE